MNEIIRKRKSIRKYDLTALDDAALDNVRAQIEAAKPLYPDIRYSVEIVDKVRGMASVSAPHYLIFRSEEKDGAYENIGFIGQQMDLFFSGSELGSCWLGLAKPEEKGASDLPHVISMAFGVPAEPLHRSASEFKRKSLDAISEGDDERLEAVRFAPSSMNSQNWYFVAGSGKIICYRTSPPPLLGFMFNKLGCIDMGIAICHIAAESDDFTFTKETDAPSRNGCIYTGTVI